MKDFVSQMVDASLSKEEKNSWIEFNQKFYRVLLRIGAYGFDRTFTAVDSEFEPGLKATTGAMSKEQALKLGKGKKDRVYEITATIKRIK